MKCVAARCLWLVVVAACGSAQGTDEVGAPSPPNDGSVEDPPTPSDDASVGPSDAALDVGSDQAVSRFDATVLPDGEMDDGSDASDASRDGSWAGSSDGPSDAGDSGCDREMARIDGFCVDRYEAYVVEIGVDGGEVEHSPYLPVAGLTVRAKVAPGVVPQGYISQAQAAEACALAGKRLCSASEFALACRGPDPAMRYPYGGTTRVPGNCNEGKGSPVPMFFGSDPSQWTAESFNDPRLNQWSGGLAPTGSHPLCVSPFGVFDCVGNLNEWGADPPDARGHARFRGGSYADAEVNGQGCLYVTSAHEPEYHDYSTGFRCCMDARGAAEGGGGD